MRIMARRRRKRSTFGSVCEVRPGVWRLRWWADTPSGRRRVSRTVEGTRRQAEDELARVRLDVGSAPGGSVTVGEAWERWWLPQARRAVEAGERSARATGYNESVWRRFVAPRWGSVPVSEVRPLDVQEWLSSMSQGPAERAMTMMRQVMDRCVMFGELAANPMAARYEMPTAHAKEVDDGCWDLAGLREVWGAVRGSSIEPAVILMAFGSCRVGESLGARREEVRRIDVPGAGAVAAVPITRQVMAMTGEVSEKLKNRWSVREVVVPGPMGARLLGLAGGRGGWLCRSRGGPMSQAKLADDFRTLLRMGGAQVHPPKNLRKSWQTYMRWTLGVDRSLIERMMGHIEPGVTPRHYDRPRAEDYARAVAEAYARHPFADEWDF